METRKTLVRRLTTLYDLKRQYEKPMDDASSYQRYIGVVRWIMDGGADKYSNCKDLHNKIFIASGIIRNPYAWSIVSNTFLELLLSMGCERSEYYASLLMTHRDNSSERNHLLIAHGIHPSVIEQRTPIILSEGWSRMPLRRLAYYMIRRYAILDVVKSIKNDISSYTAQ